MESNISFINISVFADSVHPETSVNALRKELEIQLEYDASDYPLPAEFVFLKCVGRCLTQVCLFFISIVFYCTMRDQ